MEKVLTIAGSDATGGGGLEADLKIFQEFGVFGLAAITSIVTMEPKTGKHTMSPLAPALIQQQIDSAFAGPIDSVKTGLLPNKEIIEMVSRSLTSYQKKIVVDPVIGGKGTDEFVHAESVEAIRKQLLPLAFITTPNLREAGILSHMGKLNSKEEMKSAAEIIHSFGVKHVVIKGGSQLNLDQAYDLHYDGSNFTFYPHPLIHTNYNHGAGCTFAAAITAALAKQYSVTQAIDLAIQFVEAAIRAGIAINPFVGHVWHGAYTHAEKRLELTNNE
ncbi:bifunctional hydroxymethylpyrimidine kinase/phosphomethylpyrimidine kinase [Enterococcus pallens]|uniref:pyridoxal kinase n=1 Tax=Enterococcus pallens ATCC BAA-351 TaxID=1158607 RepID=R2T291_9ENTE|nr:bifunctional hydroxymethylpyrimidine kinase/phosphomethylpyrimidine kinase [Enterococcus pallens]EOH94369.1 phosphomethylpyrimidine kinase [Enterococcus pallens ATCC BAA-351]EOU24248.1 phosphomethylpyrimidine kinase [Enterococcus pallens ATCC BAA-351]OJG81972.1 phosphomethylpyrimidine kinase [Enterococcus pallens]